MSKERPIYCCYPDCFSCPYPDCMWDNTPQYIYNHSKAGMQRQDKYSKSEKGKNNQRRKTKRRIDNGKNAEYCRRHYQRHRDEILKKKLADYREEVAV